MTISDTKLCPYCGEEIKNIALKCRFCGEFLDGAPSPLPEQDLVGVAIGEYTLTRKLGEGGMAEVYLGVHEALGQEVAIKILNPGLAQDSVVRQRFIQEARIQIELRHPGIVQVHTAVTRGEYLALVMEYVQGRTLADIIGVEIGPVPVDRAMPLIKQILSAMEYAHQQGVIHRDIKPSNILVSDQGVVKVMDFGIAKVVSSSKLTRTGATLGTAAYMSPEQIRGARDVDVRSDIYSLGVTFYEMLAGRTPFEERGEDGSDSDYLIKEAHVHRPPPDPRTYYPAIPEGVVAVLLTALSKDPAGRYNSAREMATKLDLGTGRVAVNKNTQAPPVKTSPTPAVVVERQEAPERTSPRAVNRPATPVRQPKKAASQSSPAAPSEPPSASRKNSIPSTPAKKDMSSDAAMGGLATSKSVEVRRRYKDGERDFSNMNLKGADFQKAELCSVTLSHANLRYAILSDADLSGADLSWTDFRVAKLYRTGLSEASLANATLSEANLIEANLRMANLEVADLRQANLSKADLSGARLCGTDLTEAKLSNAILAEADLSNTTLSHANLTGANLHHADLRGASLGTANLDNADLVAAMYNNDTIFPVDFDPEAAGMEKMGMSNVVWMVVSGILLLIVVVAFIARSCS